MLKTLWQSRLARYPLLFVTFIVLGNFSNTVTLSSCEQSTEDWLTDTMAKDPTRWGFSAPAKFTLPWLVSVDYEWVGAELGTKKYLCFFGLAIPIGAALAEFAHGYRRCRFRTPVRLSYACQRNAPSV